MRDAQVFFNQVFFSFHHNANRLEIQFNGNNTVESKVL